MLITLKVYHQPFRSSKSQRHITRVPPSALLPKFTITCGCCLPVSVNRAVRTHDLPLTAQTISEMVDKVVAFPEGTKLMVLAPVVQERKGEHVKTLETLAAQGYIRARINGEICDLSDPPKLELHKKHTIEVVIDRIKVRDDIKQRLAESFETALELSGGIAKVAPMDPEPGQSQRRADLFRQFCLPDLWLFDG